TVAHAPSQGGTAALAAAPAPVAVREGVPPPGDAAPRLVIQDEGQTREVALGARPLTLRRAPEHDIVLRSRFVSGHHARIEPDAGSHRIVDVGSTNGLLFEGRRLPANSPLGLNDGVVLRIGDPATGNFVTLTYRNQRGATRPQPIATTQSYPLDPNDPQITI